jgi:hypothetical protein
LPVDLLNAPNIDYKSQELIALSGGA